MKFSILIPAYKETFLEKAIRSVIDQSYDDWELIILNDCSPYNLDVIIESYSDARIKYFVNDRNVGAVDVVKNWNQCLGYSSGEYVICMGDDDVLCPDCLKIYSDYIKKYPDVNVFHTRSIIIDENGEQMYITDPRPEKESMYALMMHRMKEEQFIGDFCIKSSSLKANGGYYYLPLAWGSDDLTAYMCARDGGVVNVETPVFFYRKSSSTITSTGNVRIKIDSLNHLKTVYGELLSENPLDLICQLESKTVVKSLNKYFFRRQAEDISMDIRENLFRVLSWLFFHKKYNLSISCILYAVCIAIGALKFRNKK